MLFFKVADWVSFVGNDVVLGPIQPLIVERMEDTGVPLEQAICRQRMRPGSGSLCVRIYTDGPTRVLQISDVSKVATVTCIHDAFNIKAFIFLIL